MFLKYFKIKMICLINTHGHNVMEACPPVHAQLKNNASTFPYLHFPPTKNFYSTTFILYRLKESFPFSKSVS